MSRGHGNVQRHVLALLEPWPDWTYLNSLVADIFDVDGPGDDGYWRYPTRAQTESVRRAVRTLAREGLVQVGSQADGNDCMRMVVGLAAQPGHELEEE
jgi:hypothetical protein